MTSLGQLPLDSDTASSLLPETVMLAGLITIVLIPNLGDAKFRIPLTSVRVPVLLGGSRFDLTNDPRMPNRISNITFLLAFLSCFSEDGWATHRNTEVKQLVEIS